MQLSETLQLIYDLLVQHHGEKPNVDYMQRLEQGIFDLRRLEAISTSLIALSDHLKEMSARAK